MSLLLLVAVLAAIGFWLVRMKTRIYRVIAWLCLVVSICLIGFFIIAYDVSSNKKVNGTGNLNVYSGSSVEQKR